jgi:hypothetical protein
MVSCTHDDESGVHIAEHINRLPNKEEQETA